MHEKNIYKNIYKDYEKELKKMLPDTRIHHSYCVAKQAKKLAQIHGYDEKKAELAGLLHDITKALDVNEHLKIIRKKNLNLDDIQKTSPKLLHAISGSVYISECLDIKDPEIISAVRYHTTAKPNMTLLEKIIYLADFTSEDRKFEDAPDMRKMVKKSLNSGVRYGLSFTIKELVEKSSKVHPDTFFAYNYYIKL